MAARTVKQKHKRKKRPAARVAAPGLGFTVEPQPDDVTCGPACLHGVYRHYGDPISLESVMSDLKMLEEGGTLDVFLANHALAAATRPRYTPTTCSCSIRPGSTCRATSCVLGSKRRRPSRRNVLDCKPPLAATTSSCGSAASSSLRDLEPALLRNLLNRGTPVITGLSATFLYRSVRDVPDD